MCLLETAVMGPGEALVRLCGPGTGHAGQLHVCLWSPFPERDQGTEDPQLDRRQDLVCGWPYLVYGWPFVIFLGRDHDARLNACLS